MVTVGIDPHKHVHVAVAIDAAGKPIGKPLTVKNGSQLITGLLTWIRTISDDPSPTWAIEDGHGSARRLADGLLLGQPWIDIASMNGFVNCGWSSITAQTWSNDAPP